MKKALMLAVMALFSISAFAAEALKIDSAHSSVHFSVRHMLISNVPGNFTGFDGTIQFDEQDPSKSSVDVTINTATVNTNNEGRDKDLRSDKFFEVDKYPQARFVSKKIEKRGDQWVAIGDLTIKDVTKQIELPFELSTAKTPFGTAIGISATTKINRKDYHINYNRLMDNGGAVVSDDVKLEINLEAKPPRKDDPSKAAEKKEAPKAEPKK